MCLFAVLATLAIFIVIALLTTVGAVGSVVLVLFGDLIAFALIMWAIIKAIKYFKKK